MTIAKTYFGNAPMPPRSPQERALARAEAARRTKEGEDAIAAQRARLAAMPPANDNRPFRGNARVLHWLAKLDPAAAWSVRAYGHAAEMAEHVVADINDDESDEDRPAYGTGYDVDRVHGIRPTINEIVADLLRVRVVSLGGKILHRVDGLETLPTFVGHQAHLGGMRFNYHPDAARPAAGGTMTSYTDVDGRERVPRYDSSKVHMSSANDNRENWCRAIGGKGGVTRPLGPTSSPKPFEKNNILEMVLAGLSLREIGEELGHGPQYADRGAKRAVITAAEWAKARWPAPTTAITAAEKKLAA